MDALTRALVESAVAVLRPPGPVLEIGSLQVQGQAIGDLRPLFPGRQYVGCDMRAGPGVDSVERVENLGFADASFGSVLCLNVLEHAWEFRKGVAEILRVTAPAGLALVVAPFSFHIHAYPDDYWRFTPRALARLFAGFQSVLYGWQGHAKTPRLAFVLGLKTARGDLEALAQAWRRETLTRWDERPSAWNRFRAAVGGALFGKRGFRSIRHWRDLTIEVAEAQAHSPP